MSPWLLTLILTFWNRKYKYYCLYFSFITLYPSFITSWEILPALEDKICIPAQQCNILYMYNQTCFPTVLYLKHYIVSVLQNCLIPVYHFNNIQHGIYLWADFWSKDFLGFIGNPRDSFGFWFLRAHIQSSPSLEIQSTPWATTISCKTNYWFASVKFPLYHMETIS